MHKSSGICLSWVFKNNHLWSWKLESLLEPSLKHLPQNSVSPQVLAIPLPTCTPSLLTVSPPLPHLQWEPSLPAIRSMAIASELGSPLPHLPSPNKSSYCAVLKYKLVPVPLNLTITCGFSFSLGIREFLYDGFAGLATPRPPILFYLLDWVSIPVWFQHHEHP